MRHETGDFSYGIHPQEQVRVASPDALTYLGGPTVDTSRISFGEMVAGVSGLALFIIMIFFSWFGYDVGTGVEGLGVDTPGLTAFEWMSFLDIILLLICLVAVGLAAARAAGSIPQLPYPPGLIVAVAGALAVLIILFRLLVPGDGPIPGDLGSLSIDATREIGVFLGLIAAAGIAFGGYTAMNERATGQAPPA